MPTLEELNKGITDKKTDGGKLSLSELNAKSTSPSVVGTQQIDPTAGQPQPLNIADVLTAPKQVDLQPSPLAVQNQQPVSPEPEHATLPSAPQLDNDIKTVEPSTVGNFGGQQSYEDHANQLLIGSEPQIARDRKKIIDSNLSSIQPTYQIGGNGAPIQLVKSPPVKDLFEPDYDVTKKVYDELPNMMKGGEQLNKLLNSSKAVSDDLIRTYAEYQKQLTGDNKLENNYVNGRINSQQKLYEMESQGFNIKQGGLLQEKKKIEDQLPEITGGLETIQQKIEHTDKSNVDLYNSLVDDYKNELATVNQNPLIVKYNGIISDLNKLGGYSDILKERYPDVVKADNEQSKINKDFEGAGIVGKTGMALKSFGQSFYNASVGTRSEVMKTVSALTDGNPMSWEDEHPLSDDKYVIPEQLQKVSITNPVGVVNATIGMLPTIATFIGASAVAELTEGFGLAPLVESGALSSLGIGAETMAVTPEVINGAGTAMAQYAIGYGDGVQKGVDAGLTPEEAKQYSFASNAMASLIFSKVMPRFQKMAQGFVASESPSFNAGIEQMLNSVKDGGHVDIKSGLKTFGESLKNSLAENISTATGLTGIEASDKLTQILSDKITGKKNFDTKLDIGELTKSWITNFLTVAPMSAFEINSSLKRQNEINNYMRLSIAANADTYKNALLEKLNNKSITQERFDEVNKVINESVLAYNKIPKDLDAPTKSELIPLLSRRNQLENEPIKTAAIKKELNDIENNVSEVLNNRDKVEATKGKTSGKDSFIVTKGDMTQIDKESEFAGDNKKNILSQIKGVVKAIGEKAHIVVHKTNDSYLKAVEETGADPLKFYGTEAVFDKDGNDGKGVIHFNLSKMKDDTVFHEGAHNIIAPFLKANPEFAKQKYEDLVSVLNDKISGEGEFSVEAKKMLDELNSFAERYVDKKTGEEDYVGAKSEEPLVEFINRLATGRYNDIFDKPENKGILDTVKDWIKSIFKALGLHAEKMKLDSSDDVISFARKMSDAFKQGKEIKTEEVERSNNEVMTPSDLKAKIVGAFDKIGFEESDDYQKLKESGHINEDYDLKESAGKPVVVINPDTMMTGRITTPSGKKIVEGNGGLHFVSKFGDVWASSNIETASILKNNINTAIKKDIAAGGDGKIQVILTKGALAKNLTSHNGSKGAMAVLEHLVDEKLIGLSDFRKALTDVGKKYGIDFKGNADTKSIHQDISDKFFGVKDSTFDKRGFFVNDIIDHLAQNSQSAKDNIEGIRDALNSNELGRKIKFARAGVVDSIGLLFSDEATKGAGESSVYATIEVSKPVVVKRGQHGSYPFHVRQEDGSRPVLNIIKDKPHITDVVNDVDNNPVPRNFENVKGAKMSGATKLGSNNTGWARGFIKSKEELSGELKQRRGDDLIASTEKKKFMTEDSKGNYVFFHYSHSDLSKKGIDPKKFGSNNITSREEKGKSIPVSMYYTEPDMQETGTGHNKHVVRIPKKEVYPFNEDPLNLLPEARKLFGEKFPERAFDLNNQIAWVAKLAADKGYKMTVGDWGTNSKGKVNSLRAETPLKLIPELVHKPIGLNSIEMNPNIEDFRSNRKGGLKARKEEPNENNTTIHQSPSELKRNKFLEKGKQTREIFSVDDVSPEVAKYTWSDINNPEQKYETTLSRVRKGGKYFWKEEEVKKLPPDGKRLFSSPNPETKLIADKYKQENNIQEPSGQKIYNLDTERAKRIADAYEEMKHDPFNPAVKKSYEALSNETKKQYEAVKNAGYKLEIYEGEGEPYANSQEMIDDLKNNKHLFIFGTENGFGQDKITDTQREENPLLHDSGYKDVNGKTLLMNDLFRGVHDFFGHSERGNSFGAKGEENAWDVHARMFTPEARKAMTTETRGQNSWVNFGKHLRNEDGTIKNVNAKDKPFAEQKIGLLPDEFSQINNGELKAKKVLDEIPKGSVINPNDLVDKEEILNDVLWNEMTDQFKGIKVWGGRASEGAAYYDPVKKEIAINKNHPEWRDKGLMEGLMHEYIHYKIHSSEERANIEAVLDDVKKYLIDHPSDSEPKDLEYIKDSSNDPQEVLTYYHTNQDVKNYIDSIPAIKDKVQGAEDMLLGDSKLSNEERSKLNLQPENNLKARKEALGDPEFDILKDDYLGSIDADHYQASVEALKLQKEIQAATHTLKLFGSGLKKTEENFDRKWKTVDKAIQIYIDLKTHPEHHDMFYDKLTDGQKKIVDMSQNLTPEQQAIADKIAGEYEKLKQDLTDAGILHSTQENYVSRAWDFENSAATDVNKKFVTSSRHTKQRTLGSILEGWAEGYKLKIEGATNNLATYKKEMANVLAARQLIDAGSKVKVGEEGEEQPLFSTYEREGYKRVENRYFTKWKRVGKVDPITKEGDIAEDIRLEMNGGGKGLFIAEDGTVFQRLEIYAPDAIAKRLNNILGESALKGNSVADALTKAVGFVKNTMLFTSFFHHQAFLRNHLLSGNFNSLAELNPAVAYKKGLKLLESGNPQMTELIKAGLTIKPNLDYEENLVSAKKKHAEKLDKHGFEIEQKNRLLKMYESQHRFLFEKLGAGLKAIDSMNVYTNELRKHPEKDPKEIARIVAAFQNENFGGLHLQIIERNPTKQHLLRLLMLAPDWTESNLQMAKKAFKGGYEGKFYRAMWGKVFLRAAVASVATNLMMALMPDTNDPNKAGLIDRVASRYKRAWDEGHLNWTKLNISPLAHMFGANPENDYYFSIFGHYTDPVRLGTAVASDVSGSSDRSETIGFFFNKGSILTNTGLKLVTGKDWKGDDFTTFMEFMGLDDKGNYKENSTNKRTGVTHLAGSPKGGQLEGKLTKFSIGATPFLKPNQFVTAGLEDARSMLPLQIQGILQYAQGESDGVTLTSNMLGAGVTPASIKRKSGFDPLKLLGITQDEKQVESDNKNTLGGQSLNGGSLGGQSIGGQPIK